MVKRNQTIPVKVGNVIIGNNDSIIIQSMTNTKTTDVKKTVRQIKQLQTLGCNLVRVAINNDQDIAALKKIIKQVNIPIIADTHFDHNLAIKAIIAGAKKVRINPGNLIGGIDNFKAIIITAKKYYAAIRIGINTGSLKTNVDTNKQVIELMREYIKVCEDLGFDQIILSVKSSSIHRTIELNELLAKNFKYPIHLGLTEAGDYLSATIKSTIALTPLLSKKIGNTIRISITGSPLKEIPVAKRILHFNNIKQDLTEIISCPTCDRTSKSFFWLFKKIIPYIDTHPNKKIKVAIMGCYINGINEAKEVDLGVYCIKNKFVLIKQAKTIGTYHKFNIVNKFKKAYESF